MLALPMDGDPRDEVRRLAADTIALAHDTPLQPLAAQIARRLDEPLRVAIAGRTKAGKSTLLNALVGERLAPTDAGECTRVVTWYRHALGYEVGAVLRSGERRTLDFRRDDGVLAIDLRTTPPATLERIEVGWPSGRLRDLTLIDTPGLGSLDEASSARTSTALLGEDLQGSGDADAVIYLMRHLHRSDARFLEAFTDRSVAAASPANAIVVLSRADEIGAARPDALDSARAIASRSANDPQVRRRASGVVSVAGLIAETGATLRQQEFAWIRDLAQLPDDRRDALLVSVDRFRDPGLHPHGSDIREELLRRFGLFGLRAAIAAVADGRVRSSGELSDALLERSGIRDLQRLLAERYTARAGVLKAWSALAGLRSIASRLEREGATGATDLVAAIERLEMTSGDIALLRLLHLVLGDQVPVTDAERREVERLCGGGSAAERLGLPASSGPEAVRMAALDGAERWRSRLTDPLSDRPTVEAAEILCRAHETLHAWAVSRQERQ
jgi:hypothetical protein